jgi:hypothetical protein
VDRLLEVYRIVQRHFPDCVLVGETAAAVHAGHRYSEDIDTVMANLREDFPNILRHLEGIAGWKTARVMTPVQILGSLEGVEVGIRQLIRSAPLETEDIDGIRVPTLAEMTRIKGWLVVRRNALRDYLDVIALANQLGDGFEEAMARFDSIYPQPEDADPTSLQLAKQLAEPRPKDVAPGTVPDLRMWKGLQAPWTDWNYVVERCRHLSDRIMVMLLRGQ